MDHVRRVVNVSHAQDLCNGLFDLTLGCARIAGHMDLYDQFSHPSECSAQMIVHLPADFVKLLEARPACRLGPIGRCDCLAECQGHVSQAGLDRLTQHRTNLQETG